MNARFSLPNDPAAIERAAEIVDVLLISWRCIDAGERAQAASVVSESVERIRTEPAPVITIGMRHRSGTLHVSVGAYEDRGLRPIREEKATTPASLCDDATAPSVPRKRLASPTQPSDVADSPSANHRAGPPNESIVTLTDLAQRVEESPWFIRRRVASGTLPGPDGVDEAGEPIWYAATIEDWSDPTDQSQVDEP
jgi:hypothetical protein